MSIRQAKRTKSVAFNQNTATDHVVISSKPGTRIAVTGIWLRSDAANTVTFQKREDDNSTLVALSGPIVTAAAEHIDPQGQADSPVFAPLGDDEDFVITLGSAQKVAGWVTYTQETI